MVSKKFMNITNKTILIGPTGFMGASFLEKHPEIIGVSRKPLPEHLTNQCVQIKDDTDFSPLDNVPFDNVIFMIGCSDHHVLNAHPSKAIEDNAIALSRFLWYLRDRKRKVNKIINFTTMLQYDTTKLQLPCDESQPRNPSVNNYVLSKYVSELITQQHRDKFSIIDVRMSNVYGPTRLMRPDIVPSTIWKLLEFSKVNVWTKKPIRDFIFVDDVISAIMKLLDTDYSGPVNLGSGVGSSVGELTHILEQLSGVTIGDQDISVTGPMEFYQDISLLKSLIDWEPRYSLFEGLSITWYAMKKFYEDNDGPL